MRWWARRRLRARILIPFALLLVAALLATLGVVGAAVSGWVETSLRHQFAVTGNVFRALMGERADRLLGETSLLAADFALKRAIATYDPDTLASVAENQRERLGVDLLWIADERGRLLAAAGGAAGVGAPVDSVPPLAQVIDTGEPGVAVTEVDGALAQIVATPVYAPDPIGFLVAGVAIDDAIARQLGEATGTEISFLTRRRVLATTWPEPARATVLRLDEGPLAADLTQPPAPEDERSTFLVRGARGRLLSTLIPIDADLPAPLFVLVQASYDEALGPLVALPERFALVGVLALAAALVVAGLIAAGIAAPLQQLARAMRRVLEGDLSQRVAPRREDEVGFLSHAFNEMVAGLAEREEIKATFGRFVSREVARAVLSGDLPLGGERREVTILFQDVRGFTSIAERLTPAVLVRVVNRLFTEMVAAVESQGGVVRQFTGDGVMVLFGAPVAHADDPARAVRAGLDMMARLPALNEGLRADGLPPLRLGVGIHTGDVVTGRLGPDARSEYGVVGDAVNVASRIEGLTRDIDAGILVSAATASRLGAEFRLGRRATLPVKGKAQPVEVVEVLGVVPAEAPASGGA